MPDLLLRLATRADLPAIVAIYNQAIPGRQATADTQPVTVAEREAWFAAHDPARHPLWVVDAEAGAGTAGPLAGWIGLRPFYGRPAYQRTAEVAIYLDRARQGRGLGRRLLAAAIDRAPALGLRTLLGFIFAHNRASVALFLGAGFAPWGLLPEVAELDGAARDLAIYGRRL